MPDITTGTAATIRIAGSLMGWTRTAANQSSTSDEWWTACKRQRQPPSVAERLIATGKSSKRLIGDKAYDSAELRQWLKDRGTKPVIPNRNNRKQLFSFNRRFHTERRRIENAFGRLKDFRRLATRYDKLAQLPGFCLHRCRSGMVDLIESRPKLVTALALVA